MLDRGIVNRPRGASLLDEAPAPLFFFGESSSVHELAVSARRKPGEIHHPDL
jgi:hypothetical protein